MNDYAKKLSDPRWQKLRLQILERDKWTCQCCGSEKRTLHVHHLHYRKGAAPWEYDPSDLTTLCEECHAWESDYRGSLEKALISNLKAFDDDCLSSLVAGSEQLKARHVDAKAAQDIFLVLSWICNSDAALKLFRDEMDGKDGA